MQCGEDRKERVARCRAVRPEGLALALIDQSWRASITAKRFCAKHFEPSMVLVGSSGVLVEHGPDGAQRRCRTKPADRCERISIRCAPSPRRKTNPGLQMTTQKTTSRDLAEVSIDGAPGRGEGAARVEARFAR
jgi:hypothetical protein